MNQKPTTKSRYGGVSISRIINMVPREINCQKSRNQQDLIICRVHQSDVYRMAFGYTASCWKREAYETVDGISSNRQNGFRGCRQSCYRIYRYVQTEAFRRGSLPAPYPFISSRISRKQFLKLREQSMLCFWMKEQFRVGVEFEFVGFLQDIGEFLQWV